MDRLKAIHRHDAKTTETDMSDTARIDALLRGENPNREFETEVWRMEIETSAAAGRDAAEKDTSDHLRLAALYEEATQPDRELELEVWRLTGGTCPEGCRPLQHLHRTMSSVDAALALLDPADMPEAMCEAQRRLGARFHMHVAPWNPELDYPAHLARHLTAAALRLRYDRLRDEEGFEYDLRHLELPIEARVDGGLALRVPSFPEGVSDDSPPVARMWTALSAWLRLHGFISEPLPAPTEEMIRAGARALESKMDDMSSLHPTEHPDDGGGAVGYAFRAMAETMHAQGLRKESTPC